MKKSFVISLFGRFGNNLSQIALGKYLSEMGCRVSFDITQLGKNPVVLRIPFLQDYITPRIRIRSRYFPSIDGRIGFFGKLLRSLGFPFKVVVESTGTDLLHFELASSSWLHGYWQKTDYSRSLVEELRQEFSTKITSDVIRVHVRRGDYLGNESYLANKYYVSALNQVVSDSRFSRLSVEIISDQPELCHGEFDIPGVSVTYLPLGDPIEDFRKLARSRVLVCSRSSFSWWAGLSSIGSIYYPKDWGLGVDAQTATLYSEWIPVEIKS